MTLLLELNDAALSLYRDGRPVYQQPAVAYINGTDLLFGEAALKRTRLHPQHTNQQYLGRLNADPLPRPGAQVANHADLVYRHMLELKALVDAPLVVATPSFLTPDQLGVLLGIAQEAGIEIRGFVDIAVLMASAAPLRPPTWLLDLHATRCCLTELRTDSTEAVISRGRVDELAGAGFNACLDSWVNLLADRFVQDTRFDPMHAADTEQQLYDQLRNWAQRQHNADLSVEVRQGETARRTQISAAALQAKLAQRLAPVADKLPANIQLLVSPRSAALPGLLGALSALGLQAEALSPDQVARSMNLRTDAVRELKLVTRLPAAAAPAPQIATHALCGHRAWPLAGNRLGLPEQGHVGEVHDRGGQRFDLILVESRPAKASQGHRPANAARSRR